MIRRIQHLKHAGVKITIDDVLFTVLYNKGFYNADSDGAGYPHMHYMFETHYITGGSGYLYLQNTKIRVSPGMCILISPRTVHFFKADTGTIIERFDILFDHEMLKDSKKACGIQSILDSVTISQWKDEEIIPLCSKLTKRELASMEFAYNSVVTAMLTVILISLLRNAGIGAVSEIIEDSTKQDMNIKTFTVIETFFAQHYASRITQSKLALELSVSPRHLNRIMKRYFGMPFQQKLIHVRMDVAKNLLEQTNLPIAHVAEQTGYEYISSFCNQFYKITGMRPGQYRLLRRKDIAETVVLQEN